MLFQAHWTGALGFSVEPVIQHRARRWKSACETVRADVTDAAAEARVPPGTGPGGDAAGIGAPQPDGVPLPVPQRALELQHGRPGKPPEAR